MVPDARVSIVRVDSNDNYVRIRLVNSTDPDAEDHVQQTKTLEDSGKAPKWKNGEGENLIFHGLHLESITLVVRCLVLHPDFVGWLCFLCVCVCVCVHSLWYVCD